MSKRPPLVITPALAEQMYYLLCEMREFFFDEDAEDESEDARLYNRGTELLRQCRPEVRRPPVLKPGQISREACKRCSSASNDPCPTHDMTRVIFRAFKDTGEVIAFFVDIDEGHGRCASYMHVGQHSSGCYPNDRTRPATEKEYASLQRELEGAPYNYNLRVITRYVRKRCTS